MSIASLSRRVMDSWMGYEGVGATVRERRMMPVLGVAVAEG